MRKRMVEAITETAEGLNEIGLMSDKDKNSLLELCTSDSKVLSILGGIGRKDSQNINEKDHEKILDILTESLSSNGFYFCGHTEIVSE